MYHFKEIFYTIQGEGHHAGQPAVFARFTGCNLWSGREEDRQKAICQFCDTDFVGTDGENGGKYEATAFVDLAARLWPSATRPIWVVFTGGEPLLQLDETLIKTCHDNNIFIAVETNGTLPAPDNIDWVCVSPKAGSDIVITSGDELKLVYPQKNFPPDMFEDWDFDHFSLQPMDSEELASNTKEAIAYCQQHPQWRLSVQIHKVLGLP